MQKRYEVFVSSTGAIFYAYAGLISRKGVRRVTDQRLRTDIARHFDHFLGTQSRG